MLKTKLCLPTVNKNIISREKLLTKLQHTKKGKLTLVTAPAGYGKTTAVLDWLGKCGLPYAWLSLDARDNDPMVFWQYVYASLEEIAEGITKDVEYVLSSQELIRAEIHISILIDRLSKISSDFFFVLDDLHLIDTPSILNGLSYLIDYLPEKMHLIFISRTLPDLEWARHRIKWQLLRLEAEDLRFGAEEILQFYQARGITLQNNELDAIEKYTEGWVAALVAATLSMGDGGGRDALAALSRVNRDIGQYLRDEVVRGWPSEKQSFAMKISILDTLWPDLCNAVAGVGIGNQLLKEMAEGNAFLAALDGQRQAYRYHHLFKSFLRELLQEMYPEEIPGLYTRAGCWFREQGLIPEAIEYYLSGGAYAQACELIEHRIDHLIHKNDFGRLLSWVERLPAESRDNSFKSAAIYATYYAETGQYDLSRQWIERMKVIKDDSRYTSIPSWEAISSRNCIMTEANLLIREGDLSFLTLISRISSLDGFQNYKMREYYDFNTADIYFYRCPIYKLKDVIKGAPEEYSKLVGNYRKMLSKNPGYAPLAAGEYLYESGRPEEALPYLLKAQEEARESNCPGALVPAMVTIARIKRAGGDVAGAFAVLEECERQLRSTGKPHWNYSLHAFRCRLFIDTGNMDKVREWVSASRLDLFAELGRSREFELLVYVRALILLNRPQEAELILQRLLAFTGASRPHSRVEILNLLALLAFKNHHAREALKYIDESLDIGMAEGYVRSYLDEFSLMAPILRAYIKSRRNTTDVQHAKEKKSFAGSLLKQIRGSAPQTANAGSLAGGMAEKILEQLTEQEERVFKLMAGAATNQEICDELGISLWTVKTYTGNIYGKLCLKNRVQCIKLARELGLT